MNVSQPAAQNGGGEWESNPPGTLASPTLVLKTRGTTRYQSPPNGHLHGDIDVFLGFCYALRCYQYTRFVHPKANSKGNVMAKTKPIRPRKPRPDFPLFPHARGYWAKKVKGRLHYFGKVASDPQGQAALDLWIAQKDDLLAGRKPRAKRPDEITVRTLANAFLTHKQDLVNAGELSQWTFQEYHNTCARLVKALGRERPIDDLVADDFRHLRDADCKAMGTDPPVKRDPARTIHFQVRI